MKPIPCFLLILSWQIIGFVATLTMALPTGNFHHFVHELILCLTFTNLIGISGLLVSGFYLRVLKDTRWPRFLKIAIPILLMQPAIYLSLNMALKIGGFICRLDGFLVDRWHLSLLIVNFTILVVVGIVSILLALYERLAARLEHKIGEIEKLQRFQIESKLALLQARINPHFLFNTLNTMLDVLHRDVRQAEKLILNLSDIYRKTLLLPENRLVPLEEEMILVREYLEIEKIRMGDRLQTFFEVDRQLERFPTPPMMLQILVENAIKHGLSPKRDGGEVKILARCEEQTVTLEVTDSGVGIDPARCSEGFGLVSIRQRLKLLYQNGRMEITNLAGGGTRVQIILPYAA